MVSAQHFEMSAETKADECSNNVHSYSATRYSIQLFQWPASTTSNMTGLRLAHSASVVQSLRAR